LGVCCSTWLSSPTRSVRDLAYGPTRPANKSRVGRGVLIRIVLDQCLVFGRTGNNLLNTSFTSNGPRDWNLPTDRARHSRHRTLRIDLVLAHSQRSNHEPIDPTFRNTFHDHWRSLHGRRVYRRPSRHCARSNAQTTVGLDRNTDHS